MDQTLDAGDATAPVTCPGAGLAPGASGVCNIPFQSPAAPGEYFLIARVDDDNNLEESNEQNNIISQSFTVGPSLFPCDVKCTLTSFETRSVSGSPSARQDQRVLPGF